MILVQKKVGLHPFQCSFNWFRLAPPRIDCCPALQTLVHLESALPRASRFSLGQPPRKKLKSIWAQDSFAMRFDQKVMDQSPDLQGQPL